MYICKYIHIHLYVYVKYTSNNILNFWIYDLKKQK